MFSACERDRGMRRVLNATAQVVTFILSLFGGLRLHGCHVSCAGQSADVSLGKATASYVAFRSRREASVEVFRLIRRIYAVFGVLSPRVHRVERGRRRTVDGLRVLREDPEKGFGLGLLPVKATDPSVTTRSRQADPSVSSILDTLTPVLELYIRLRERRQRVATCVVLVGLHCSLACACGAVVGPFIRDCEIESCVKVLPVVACFVVALVWLWFLWWYLVVVGVEVEVVCPSYYLVCGFRHIVVWGYNGLALGQRSYYPCVWGLPVKLVAYAVVSAWVVRLCGPEYWAQSAHRFSACERDRGMRRVLNVTALVVAFMLPLFGSLRLHGYRVSCDGQSVDVGLGKATASYVAFRSRRRAASRSQPLCVFKEVLAGQSCGKLSRPGEAAVAVFRLIQRIDGVFGLLSPRVHRVERGRRRTVDGLRVLREDPEKGFRLGLSPVKATDPSIATRSQQAGPSC
ncbi:hypothetical protein Taro_013860 [Colocasia esculenta]|uniref:Uncharacterized protein n=1 Tax=Colocasia esculenta TaxID=4460 RepID=A0A843UHP6_COLES|nr:hypothetical protein [Colocasia esculenta]